MITARAGLVVPLSGARFDGRGAALAEQAHDATPREESSHVEGERIALIARQTCKTQSRSAWGARRERPLRPPEPGQVGRAGRRSIVRARAD